MNRLNRLALLFAVFCLLTIGSGTSVGQGLKTEKATDLRAASGKTDITPATPVYIAGYGADRRSQNVHDPLIARCLVLDSGGTRVAIVSCDLIGLPRYQIEQIRKMVKTIPPQNVIVAATHTHSGPDTLGQWGPDVRTSGVDQAWMTNLRNKVAHLVDDTTAKLQPAALRFASTMDVGRVSKNIRVPRILDTELGVMQAVSVQTGKPIATLVNYACHPEILNNHSLTADFPHWLYETVENATGGVCLYLNGAQGGMVTADFDETTAPKFQNWGEAERIGKTLGEKTLAILREAEAVPSTPLKFERRAFTVPLDNQKFKLLIGLGVFPKNMVTNGQIETEVCRLTLGPAEFLTLPGEVLPNIGLYLKSRMTGKYKFLLGLTNDELGYILTPEDFVLPLYSYEASVSVGPEIEPRMVANLRELMAK